MVHPGTADMEALPADFNGDGIVDSLDLSKLLQSYGDSSGNNRFDGDANGDGAVSLQDLLILKKSFGDIASSPPAAAAAALRVSIQETISTNKEIDRAITEQYDEPETPEQEATLPIRKSQTQRYTTSVDQAHETLLSTSSIRTRANPLHRARRGHRTESRIQFITD